MWLYHESHSGWHGSDGTYLGMMEPINSIVGLLILYSIGMY